MELPLCAGPVHLGEENLACVQSCPGSGEGQLGIQELGGLWEGACGIMAFVQSLGEKW